LLCAIATDYSLHAHAISHRALDPVRDFARLGEEVHKVIDAGADLIHFDVMDNHYVPEPHHRPAGLRSAEAALHRPIDVHLMVKPVDRIVPDFRARGADNISFHPEASEHVDRTIGLIREHGCTAGLVFNPATPLDWLMHTIDKLDLVLIMSVNPGFGGQSFIPHALEKLKPPASSSTWRCSARAAPSTSRSTAA
jgi:ribulose-phosphate 3-epimerase